MKKTIAILLVALIAVGSAFAAFTGDATVGLGVNFDKGTYGFIDNSTGVGINFELTNLTGEDVSEGEIYAGIKGSLVLEAFEATDEDSIYKDLPDMLVKPGTWTDNKVYIGLGASIDEAFVVGENWKVSLLGMPDGPDYASSVIDTYKSATKKYEMTVDKDGTTKNASFAAGYAKANGVEVTIYDYTVGFGLDGNWKADTLNVAGFVQTPEYDFNGLKLQAAGVASKKSGSGYFDTGLSAKAAYANDTISASVATDLGLSFPTAGDDLKFGADVAANFTYDFIAVDAYYGTNPVTDADKNTTENLLSTKVVADLNNLDVPVKVTVTGADLINDQDFDLSVEVAIDAITLTPSVGYVIASETFNAGIEAKYAAAEAFTVKGATSFETAFADNDLIWKASASVETTTLIPGATLKLAWSDAKDLLDNKPDESNNYGKIVASCKVDF